MHPQLKAIRSSYIQIAQQLGASDIYIHFYTKPQHSGTPHIEYDGANFQYIVTERGLTLETRQTQDPEEILFWLVQGLTHTLAIHYEYENRIPDQDFRRVMFAKHIELLAQVNPKWAELQQQKYGQTLQENPFVDR